MSYPLYSRHNRSRLIATHQETIATFYFQTHTARAAREKPPSRPLVPSGLRNIRDGSEAESSDRSRTNTLRPTEVAADTFMLTY